MNKTTFLAAFALVSNPDTWCQGHYAADGDGNKIFGADSRACKWCSVGAYQKVTNRIDFLAVPYMLDAFTKVNYGCSLIAFNDSHTHAEVVALWRQFGVNEGYL